jgi:glycosyltransferase involved in cell wall biosynthesis
MAATTTVSVLMSVKDGLPHLDRAVASILSQTFADFEFVIVDNASTDGSREYLELASEREPRIVLLRNERDLGHSGGLNRGLAACRGEWVARMDADDVAMPDRLARQLAFVQKNRDVRATSCIAWYIDAEGRRIGRTVCDVVTRPDFRHFRERNLPIGILHPGAFVRRDLLARLGGYRGEFDPANDIDLWCRISDDNLILVQPELLMEYRIHSSSISGSNYERGRLKSLWARDCMIARREGRREPSWEWFLESRRAAPWWLRLNRWRKMRAKSLYRQSAQDHISAHHLKSLADITLAVLLQPEYALPRLKVQIFG